MREKDEEALGNFFILFFCSFGMSIFVHSLRDIWFTLYCFLLSRVYAVVIVDFI